MGGKKRKDKRRKEKGKKKNREERKEGKKAELVEHHVSGEGGPRDTEGEAQFLISSILITLL